MKEEEEKMITVAGIDLVFSKTASLDVDAQCGFSKLCLRELPVPGALGIVPELNKQATLGQLRVASRDAHSDKAVWIATPENPQYSEIKGYSDLDMRWNSHCVVGTLGFDFLPGLDPEAYSFIAYKGIEIDKHPYGACYHDLADTKSTGLIEFLQVKNIENVIVGGLATSFCVKKTVLQLCACKKFRVFVNLLACRDITGVDTNSAITEMKDAGAVIFFNV
jgi:nicotinamidase/pyrazinamidase